MGYLLPQFNFGQAENDAHLVFASHLAKRTNKLTFWQVCHLKSAAHEGYLTYKIFLEREKQNLPIGARNLFSVHSPLESFLKTDSIFESLIFDRLGYLVHRKELVEFLEELAKRLTAGSNEQFKVDRICQVVKLQSYGFGRAALQSGKIDQAITAFEIAKVLEKSAVQQHLKNFAASDVPDNKSGIVQVV